MGISYACYHILIKVPVLFLRDWRTMKVLIIIPAYNEEESIVRVVDNLTYNFPEYDYVIINDGSSDHTKEVCERHGYHLISHKSNLGLAGAFQTGMKYADQNRYDAAIQFDGDGQHLPEYIAPMAEKLNEGYDIIIGSRFVTEKKPVSMRMFGNNLISSFIWLTTGKYLKDSTSGMRMYNRRMIHLMANELNMGPEPDTVAYLLRCGAKVAEIQVHMEERQAGQSYLTPFKSMHYMSYVCLSILFISWFRKKKHLEEVKQ